MRGTRETRSPKTAARCGAPHKCPQAPRAKRFVWVGLHNARGVHAASEGKQNSGARTTVIIASCSAGQERKCHHRPRPDVKCDRYSQRAFSGEIEWASSLWSSAATCRVQVPSATWSLRWASLASLPKQAQRADLVSRRSGSHRGLLSNASTFGRAICTHFLSPA
jgi:hypothetical protein